MFERRNRQLVLTEAGRIALAYADSIFKAGDELVATLRDRAPLPRQSLRVGAVTTLSRNFQMEFLRPLLARHDVDLVIHSGSLRELLAQLAAHTLDLVLSNQPAPRDAHTSWHSHLLAQQPASLVSRPDVGTTRLKFPQALQDLPVVLPSSASSLRTAFDVALDRAGIRPIVLAEVDDMAMLRLVARASPGITLVPPVVVRDELKAGLLVERCRIASIHESFYAVSPSRRFPNPLVRELIARPLAMRAPRR